MMYKKSFNYEFKQDYKWFVPRKPNLILTVLDDKWMKCNRNLYKYMPKHIIVGIVEQSFQHIGIQETDEEGFLVHKNGRIYCPEVIKALRANGLSLPAHFIVDCYDKSWRATLLMQCL